MPASFPPNGWWLEKFAGTTQKLERYGRVYKVTIERVDDE